jgi:hypothetical protein
MWKPLQLINVKAHGQFLARYSDFVQEAERLREVYVAIETESAPPAEIGTARIIQFLVSTVWDDLSEIVVLHANGYPLGSLKILRSMFEHTVHLGHFVRNPADIEPFWKYGLIDEVKFINYYPDAFRPEDVELMTLGANVVRGDFQVPVCGKCKDNECKPCQKTKTASSWMGKRNLLDLAKDLEILPVAVFSSYYMGLVEAHPKIQSLKRREYKDESGTIRYRHDETIDQTDNTLMSAHYLLLFAIGEFLDYCGAESCKSQYEKRTKRFNVVWRRG